MALLISSIVPAPFLSKVLFIVIIGTGPVILCIPLPLYIISTILVLPVTGATIILKSVGSIISGLKCGIII